MTNTTTENNLHAEISAVKNSPATVSQCNYLVSLYRQELVKAVTDKHENINVSPSNDFINFRKKFGGLQGTFAMHLYNSFIPKNRDKYLKNEVSKLISDALHGKFSKQFINSFIKSKNAYVKPQKES